MPEIKGPGSNFQRQLILRCTCLIGGLSRPTARACLAPLPRDTLDAVDQVIRAWPLKFRRLTAMLACWNSCHWPTRRSIGWLILPANIWKATHPGEHDRRKCSAGSQSATTLRYRLSVFAGMTACFQLLRAGAMTSSARRKALMRREIGKMCARVCAGLAFSGITIRILAAEPTALPSFVQPVRAPDVTKPPP